MQFIRSSNIPVCVIALLLLAGVQVQNQASDLPQLKVSENKRYLVTEDGKPFFWLGDTAWELFHRTTREEAIHYLDVRSKQGFNVVQAVALAEEDGLNVPNSYGHLPLTEFDPTKPTLVDGPENDYWDHVDFVVAEANRRGIYVGFLPTWGDKWNKKWGVGPEVFTVDNAEAYGKWLGDRYRDAGVIWILGGDRPVENDNHKEIIRAMARGLRSADGGKHLITFHPTGGQSSSGPFHKEEWLDFNMRQNGHVAEFTGRYDKTRSDYDLRPIKPVIDGEPIYEDHPISFDAKKLGHSVATDVRRPLYWDLFEGAFGHTYGNHAIWQFWNAEREPKNNPLLPWKESLLQQGALQMQHGRALLESRPFLTRIPDSSFIVADRVATNIPGAGRYQFVGTRDEDGTYLMVYVPVGRKFSLQLEVLKAEKIQAWWFNPRTGRADSAGIFVNEGKREFLSPDPGESIDWLLVLDDASKGYKAPGTK